AVGDLTNRKEVTRLLEKINTHEQNYSLKIQFLRSLKQACYRADADGHYGLYKTFYAHFTSPIRRYADLTVHRIFDFYLAKQGLDTAPARVSQRYSKGDLDSMAEHLSITEQNSTEAERESVKIKLMEFFERELDKDDKDSFEAIITDVKNHGMFIELTESMAFGMVHISTLRDDLYRVSEDGQSIVGRKQQRRYGIGDHIYVKVERVDRFKRQIDFRLAEDKNTYPYKEPFTFKEAVRNQPKKQTSTKKKLAKKASKKSPRKKRNR
ncbi:MAG: RNB domain-containing ribonuclease, partial [Verrucomicrobiota bacterium]